MGKIMIVDDSRTSRKILRVILEEAGFEVVAEATDGEMAVEKYKELNPEVVTMDITMPKLDGVGALSQIIEYDPDAKVIMVTAAGQKSNVVEAIKIGAYEFVTKPFDETVILDVINKAIEAKNKSNN